jgi:hypothetical protein
MYVDVDSCIAPIVSALNRAAIRTTSSCCGHGKDAGHILLDDGRGLVIVPNYEDVILVDIELRDLDGVSRSDEPLLDRINKLEDMLGSLLDVANGEADMNQKDFADMLDEAQDLLEGKEKKSGG